MACNTIWLKSVGEVKTWHSTPFGMAIDELVKFLCTVAFLPVPRVPREALGGRMWTGQDLLPALTSCTSWGGHGKLPPCPPVLGA